MTVADRFRLDGKVALVTGASRGIGLATAKGFAEAGARVILSSDEGEICRQEADALGAKGYDAIGIGCDVTDQAQLDALVAQAERSIADRPAAVEQTQTRARERTESIARARHEDPACAALADLPICPAVARQLWPPQKQAGAGRDAPHHD